jgi:hypothetical protein
LSTLPPGTLVDLSEYAGELLRFPPPDGDLVIVVHPAALRATWDRHTQVALVESDDLLWAGALGEDWLVTLDDLANPTACAAMGHAFLHGERLWQILRPGSLLVEDAPRVSSTIYAGSERRPWVVLGETATGDPIAAPLNDASNPKWWTPVVPHAALSFPGNVKDSQVELAHVWSLPASIEPIGEVTTIGRAALEAAVRAYVTR